MADFQIRKALCGTKQKVNGWGLMRGRGGYGGGEGSTLIGSVIVQGKQGGIQRERTVPLRTVGNLSRQTRKR